MKAKALKHKNIENTWGRMIEFGNNLEMFHGDRPELFSEDATSEKLSQFLTDPKQLEDYDLVEVRVNEVSQRRRPKTESVDPEVEATFGQLFKSLDERPWWEKMWAAVKFAKWSIYCTIDHILGKDPKVIRGADMATFRIKDDIEFGYDLNMIYSKIMYGNYGNRALPFKRDWFQRNSINWDFFMDRKGGMDLANDLIHRIEFGDFKSPEAIKLYLRKVRENYYNEKRIRMEAAGIKVEDEN